MTQNTSVNIFLPLRRHNKSDKASNMGTLFETIPVGLSNKLNIALTILFYIWQLSYDT